MITKMYSEKNNTQRYRTIGAWAMIALAIAGIILSVSFIVMPKGGSDALSGIDTFVGWSEAWSDRYEYTANFQGGNGSAGDPYRIHSAQAMARFAHDINHRDNGDFHRAHFKLVNNIDLSARRWDPIGRFEFGREFRGTFDGGGFVLSGVSSENQYERNNNRIAGLFGVLAGNVTIKNLQLNNSSINIANNSDDAPDYNDNQKGISAGLVAAYVSKGGNVTFENIDVNSGRVNVPEARHDDGYDIGGVLGSTSPYSGNIEVTVKNVRVRNTMLVNSMSNVRDKFRSGNYMGGIIGRAEGTIKISDVTLSGNDIISQNTNIDTYVGGVIGSHIVNYRDFYKNLTIENVTMTGTRFTVRGEYTTHLGGIVGKIDRSSDSIIKNIKVEDGVVLSAYASNTKSSSGLFVGGIIGDLQDGSTLTAENWTFEGTINVDALGENGGRHINAGGLFGRARFRTTKVDRATVDATISVKGGAFQGIGGIAGWAANADNNNNAMFNLTDVSAVGKISGTGTSEKYFGGAVGKFDKAVPNIKFNRVKTSVDGVGDLLVFDQAGINMVDSWQKILKPAVITQQLAQQYKLVLGTSITLEVQAQNPTEQASTLKYQWYSNSEKSTKNGNPLGGANQPKLTLSGGSEGNQYYYLRITNELLGLQMHVFSDVATVEVVKPDVVAPTIVTQPEFRMLNGGTLITNGRILLGDNAALTVKASSKTGNLSYQWFVTTGGSNVAGTPIVGQTDMAFRVPSDLAGSYQYYVEVTNTEKDGRKASINSEVTYVNVMSQEAPMISSQPQKDVTVIVGATHMLTVTALSMDNSALTYQWYKTNDANDQVGTAINGINDPYIIVEGNTVGTTYYFAKVTANIAGNQISVLSEKSAVKVEQPKPTVPKIVGEIEVQEFYAVDTDITLQVFVDRVEDGVLSYQWYRSPAFSNVGGTPVQDAVSPIFTFRPTEEGSYYFYVVITNTLTVNNAIKEQTTSNVVEVVVVKTDGKKNAAPLADNLPWIIVIIGSAGVMFAAFVLLVKKTVVEY